MDRTRFEELKEAYVLRALPERERQTFEAYLATHPELRHEVDELASIANLLTLACEEHEPSPQLRRSLLAQIESEASAPRESAAPWWSRLRVAFSWRQISLATVAVAFAGLLIWNITLQSNLQNQQTYTLQASGPAAGAEGKVVHLRDSNEAVLVADNLPALPEDKTYEIWVIQGDEAPMPSGLFRPQNGRAAAPITNSVRGADAVAVTIEPAPGGSSAPTSEPLLKAEL